MYTYDCDFDCASAGCPGTVNQCRVGLSNSKAPRTLTLILKGLIVYCLWAQRP